MSERPTNIWGKKGCELPNGRLCHTCCELFTINFGLDTGPYKNARSPCPSQNSIINGGQGCSIWQDKPTNCDIYHCGKENPNIPEELNRIQDLIAKSLALGLVTEDEAMKASRKFFKAGEIERVFALAKKFEKDTKIPLEFEYTEGT